jgi:glycosyltransferase 2 family protein
LNVSQIPLLLGAFSFAWLLGFIVPGAPGGLGVFEATAIAVLQHHFPSAVVISAIALYRLISILAETAGASLAWLDERFANS